MATRDVVVRFLGNASGLNQAAQQGGNAVGKFSDRTQKMATVGLAGVAAFGAGLVSALKGGVEGLREGEEAEAAFTQAMGKVPRMAKVSADAVKSYAEAVQAKTRFSYEDALAADTMLVANDGVQRALKAGIVTTDDLTRTTLDLATVQKTDSASAAKFLGKALQAPEKAAGLLRKAGISLSASEQKLIKDMVANGQTAQAQSLIYDALREKVDGAAEAAGNTTAGQLERAQAAWGEVQESLATQVIPVMTRLVGWLLKITTWAQDNPGKVKAFIVVAGGLAAVITTVSLAIKAWTFITKIHTAAMAALNVVMFANPAVLITAAIVALVAVVVVIATKTRWFQNIWHAAWGAITGAAQATFGWVKSNWPLILAILTGPVGLAVLAVVKNFDRIKAAGASVKDALVNAFSGVADIITAPFRAAVDGIRSAWNSTIGGKGFPGVSLPGLPDIPGVRIPMLAAGGTISRRGWTVVGDAGPELLNLGRGAQVVPLDRAGGGDMTVEIHANGPTLDDIVAVKIRQANRATKQAVLAGARRT